MCSPRLPPPRQAGIAKFQAAAPEATRAPAFRDVYCGFMSCISENKPEVSDLETPGGRSQKPTEQKLMVDRCQ
jgi:hypothetical protein